MQYEATLQTCVRENGEEWLMQCGFTDQSGVCHKDSVCTYFGCPSLVGCVVNT